MVDEMNLAIVIRAVDQSAAALRAVQAHIRAVETSAGGATRGVASFEGSLGRVGAAVKAGPLQLLTTVLHAAVPLSFGAASVASLKFAMDAVETRNLFEVSMGGMTGAADAFVDHMNRSLGLNRVALQQNLGMWQDWFQNMGLGQETAFAMGQNLTRLAYDLSSLRNVNPGEAFQKLQSAMAGEMEAVRRWGMDVSEAAVQAYALRNGIAAQGAELDQTTKAVIRYNLLLQQSSRAQSDLARTIGSPANQLRVFQEGLRSLGTQAGTMALPALSSGLGTMISDVLPRASAGLDTLGRAFSGVNTQVLGAAGSIALALGTGGTVVLAVNTSVNVVRGLATAWQVMWASALGPIALVVAGLGLATVAAAELRGALGSPMSGYFGGWAKFVEEQAKGLRAYMAAKDEGEDSLHGEMARNLDRVAASLRTAAGRAARDAGKGWAGVMKADWDEFIDQAQRDVDRLLGYKPKVDLSWLDNYSLESYVPPGYNPPIVPPVAAGAVAGLDALKSGLEDTRRSASSVGDALGKAREELNRFVGASLVGESSLRVSMAGIDAEIAGLQAQQAQRTLDRLNRRPIRPGARGAAQQIRRLELQRTVLGGAAAGYDLQHAQLRAALEGQNELTYAAALQGARAAQAQVAALENEKRARDAVVSSLQRQVELAETLQKVLGSPSLTAGQIPPGLFALAGHGGGDTTFTISAPLIGSVTVRDEKGAERLAQQVIALLLAGAGRSGNTATQGLPGMY